MKRLMQTLFGVVLIALLVAILSLRAEAAAVPECSLMGEGIVTDAWVKHRIFIGEDPVFGANDMATVSAHLKELRHMRVCR